MAKHFQLARIAESHGEYARAVYHYELARRAAKSPKNRNQLLKHELVCIIAQA